MLKSWLRLRNDLYCVEWGVKLYSLTKELAAKFQFCCIFFIVYVMHVPVTWYYSYDFFHYLYRQDSFSPVFQQLRNFLSKCLQLCINLALVSLIIDQLFTYLLHLHLIRRRGDRVFNTCFRKCQCGGHVSWISNRTRSRGIVNQHPAISNKLATKPTPKPNSTLTLTITLN